MARNHPEGNAGKREGQKVRDAEFLKNEFDVPARDAADLVADTDEDAERIAQAEFENERHKDVLDDVPTPESPDRSGDEKPGHHMQKTVRHTRERSGGG